MTAEQGTSIPDYYLTIFYCRATFATIPIATAINRGTTTMIGLNSKTMRAAITRVVCLTLGLCAFGTSQALAQDSWSLRISEKEGELAHTGDAMWTKWLMW